MLMMYVETIFRNGMHYDIYFNFADGHLWVDDGFNPRYRMSSIWPFVTAPAPARRLDRSWLALIVPLSLIAALVIALFAFHGNNDHNDTSAAQIKTLVGQVQAANKRANDAEAKATALTVERDQAQAANAARACKPDHAFGDGYDGHVPNGNCTVGKTKYNYMVYYTRGHVDRLLYVCTEQKGHVDGAAGKIDNACRTDPDPNAISLLDSDYARGYHSTYTG
jgi:hypothetical protein